MKKPIKIMMTLALLFLTVTQAKADIKVLDDNNNEIIYENEIGNGLPTESEDEKTDVEESDEVLNEEPLIEPELECEITDDLVISEEYPEISTEEFPLINESPIAATDTTRLQSHETIVTSFDQLKTLIESNGSNVYRTYYLGNDIVGVSGGISVPFGYSFTIDGTNPNTGARHTYTEFTSGNQNDTILSTGSGSQTMTMRNITILGQNSFGTFSSQNSSSSITHVFDNVSYTGPKITSNPNGNVMFKNSTINIPASDFAGASKEVGEVKHIELQGSNTFIQEGSGYPVFTMGDSNSITFKQNSVTSITSPHGFNDKTTGTKIVFEQNAVVNYTQPTLAVHSTIFNAIGNSGHITMQNGSELNVNRPFTNDSVESIFYTDYRGTAIINGGSIKYTHKGSQTTNSLFDLENLTVNNGADIRLSLDGSLGFTPFHVNTMTGLSDSSLSVTLGGDYTAITPIIGKGDQTGDFSLNNSKFTVKAENLTKYIVNVDNLVVYRSDIRVEVNNKMTSSAIKTKQFQRLTDSTFTYKFKEMTGDEPIINRTNDPDFTLHNSTINVFAGELKHSLVRANTFDVQGDHSEINVHSDSAITDKIIRARTIPRLSNIDINITAGTDYSSNEAMIYIENPESMTIYRANIMIKARDIMGDIIRTVNNFDMKETEIVVDASGQIKGMLLNTRQQGLIGLSTINVNSSNYNSVFMKFDSLEISGSDVNFKTGDVNFANDKPLIETRTASILAKSLVDFTITGKGHRLFNSNTDSLSVRDSQLLYTSNSQPTGVVAAKEVTLDFASFKLLMNETTNSSEALVSANKFISINSNVYVMSQGGKIHGVLEIMNEFKFIDTGYSRLALRAPSTNGIIRTGANNVTLTFEGAQFNLWETDTLGGLHDLPTRRYMPNHAFGQVVINYRGQNGNEENLNVTYNTFDSSQWDNPNTTLSFLNGKMKSMGVGSMNLELEKYDLSSLNIRGTTDPLAEIEFSYLSDGNNEIAAGYANANGRFSLNVLPLTTINNDIDAYADFLYLTNVKEVESQGSLRFGAQLPGNVVFGNLQIPSQETVFNRMSDMNVDIVDDRSGTTGWKLELVLVDHLTDVLNVNPKIENALIYKSSNGETVLIPGTRIEIANSNTHTTQNSTISWANNEGILLKITDPGSVYANTSYKTNLQWILSDLN